MSNYYHYDTGKNGKVSVNFDVNFSKLRNITAKPGKISCMALSKLII